MISKPILAITAGDPCGIGPEIIIKNLPQLQSNKRMACVIIGDQRVFDTVARRLKVPLPPWQRLTVDTVERAGNHPLSFIDMANAGRFTQGKTDALAGKASLVYLGMAVHLWKHKKVQALITAPVTKWAIQQSGYRFSGHTEYLSKAMKAKDVVMMFDSEDMRVALLTRHVALKGVSRLVDRLLIRKTITRVAYFLESTLGIKRPRIAVCGLNPHAGEGFLFGREEKTVLEPVINALIKSGIRCEGPFAADSLFAKARSYDAIIAWYHDQGLIPFKMVARDSGCQVSLGLPVIRTSPDHGSALDIAGKFSANPGSMCYSIKLAIKLLKRKRGST